MSPTACTKTAIPWPLLSMIRGNGFSFVVCMLLFVVIGAGCDREPPAPAPDPKPEQETLCVTGHSEDPSRAELEPGIRAFRDRRYDEAQKIFALLAEKYPKSASARVWWADAVLFDRDRDSKQAALDARPIQASARRLHEAGCALPRRSHYYLLMGEAYGALRLEKTESESGPREGEVKRALESLEEASRTYPHSAEVAYNLARAHCAAAQARGLGPAEEHRRACVQQFEKSLELAASLERPRFLRTHRSVEDWVVRSENQSEFGPLREHERYDAIVERARREAAEPTWQSRPWEAAE